MARSFLFCNACVAMKQPSTLPGLDALRAGHHEKILHRLQGKRIGLLTNHNGRALDGRSTLEVLRELQLDVRVLFSPEHGIEGTSEGHVKSGQTADALPIYSLYGATRRPTAQMLQDIDVLVCDLQDVGARFYTYSTTLAYCLEECAPRGIAMVLLDRPNPIGGDIVEGPALDGDSRSFVGHLDVPIRHGMTLGELAHLFIADAGLEVELHVATAPGWKRTAHWPQTGLDWLPPSPNLPDYESAAWYPGTCLLEFSKVSVGRGTDAPFRIIGAPWLDAAGLLQKLQNTPLFAQTFGAQVVSFTPGHALYEGELCHGLKFHLQGQNIAEVHFVPLGLALLATLHAHQPQEFDDKKLDASLRLLGSTSVLEALKANGLEEAERIAHRDARNFGQRREAFLLYR